MVTGIVCPKPAPTGLSELMPGGGFMVRDAVKPLTVLKWVPAPVVPVTETRNTVGVETLIVPGIRKVTRRVDPVIRVTVLTVVVVAVPLGCGANDTVVAEAVRDNSKLTSQIRCNGVVPFR